VPFALGAIGAEALSSPSPSNPQPRLPTTRLANEAAPDLILPFLAGDEVVRRQGFSPRGEQGFRLPRERPDVRARVDGGELAPLGRHIHALAIDADAREFYLLLYMHALGMTTCLD
jgi:hypothetical protein